jgi:hypothetical protein
MDNFVDAVQCLEERRLIADVADDDLDILSKPVGPIDIAVNLLDQAVQDANAMVLVEERLRNVAANESGATCYEDRVCQG